MQQNQPGRILSGTEMSEGRKIRIVLLHDKHLDMLVQPKLLASELMEMTSSHLMLRDKEYFGLCYKEDVGHYQWLTLDRRVLDHDLPKTQKPLLLYFQVRLYVESICQLKDPVTIELFYLNARQSIAQERLKCDSATVFDLAAYVLQEAHSDYADDATTRSELKALPLLPVGTLKEHPSISFCEEQVIQRYKKLTGMSRGFAIVNYMKIAENLPSYGIHFYEVKDKSGLPWWLGLSVKGITVYDFNDRFTPRKEFHWKRLLNLYYRDRKFSIQVHDSKSEGDVGCGSGRAVAAIGTTGKSRRLLGQNQAATNVQSWFSSSSQLTKCIWSMAVCQHQKYIELRTTKTTNRSGASTIRSLVEVASDLTNSCLNQTPNASDCSSLSAASHSSASNSKLELNVETNESYKAAMQEMYNALKERKETLESQLMKKTKLLVQLCLQEAELTGFLPPETPVSTGGQLPKFQRRIGTSFTLSPKVLEREYHNSKKDGLKSDLDDFDQLEVDLEIQDKITQAALMLAKDKSVRRSVRKKRALSYQRASQRLKDMEVKLLEHQLQSAARKNSLAGQSNISDGHLSEDSRDILDSENEINSAFSSPLVSRHELDVDRLNLLATSRAAEVRDDKDDDDVEPRGPNWSTAKVTQSSSEQSLLPSRSHVTDTALSSPCSPVVETGHRQTKSNDVSPSPAPSPMVARQRLGGYIASSIYSTRTQYRSQRYPTLCGTYVTSDLLDEDPEMSSSNSNLYNVWSPKSPFYDSGDELKTPSPAAQRPPGFFVSQTEALKCEVGASGSLMKTSHSSSDVLGRPQTKPDSCVYSRCGMSPVTSERKLTIQRCALLPSSDVVRGTCAMPPSDVVRSTCVLPPSDIGRSTCAMPPNDIVRSTCVLPPSDITRNTCAMPPSDIVRGACVLPPSDVGRSTCALPPSDIIRSTCHVVTNVNRSCYGNGSAHVVQNVRTETSRVYEATSGVTMTTQSLASAEAHLTPDHPDAIGCETTVQKYHNYIEISKPFEMSDFYKYSERLRRQRLVGQVVSLGSSQTPEDAASVARH